MSEVRLIDWQKYQIRICRSLHECSICEKEITSGQKYFDGGYGRRAHVECAELQISFDGSGKPPEN